MNAIRISPIPLKTKEKCNQLDKVWLNNTALKIILFLMKNNNAYYTREEIAKNSYITMSALERYLPKLANSEFDLISERFTSGTSKGSNHLKEYHINQSNSIIKALYQVIKEVEKTRHDIFKRKIG